MRGNRPAPLVTVAPATGLGTATSVTTTRAATTASRTFFPRTCFVDGQIASVQDLAIHRVDRCLRLLRRTHCDEGKSFRFAGHAVHYEVHFTDIAMCGKGILQIIF